MTPLPTTILFLEALPTISGGQAVLLNLIPELRKDYNLVALLPHEGPFSEALQVLQVPYYFAPVGQYSLVRKTAWDVVNYTLRFPWLILFTWRLIRSQHVDLVYANSGRTFLWGTLAAMVAGCPVIWHHHNLFADGKTLTLLNLTGRLPTVRRIICVSDAASQQFPGLTHKTVVIPTGVNIQQFHPNSVLGENVRRELNIAVDKKVVGIIGDIIPLKGQHIVLNAISKAPPNVQYLVVGDIRPGDEESQQYFNYLREVALDNVIFTGRRKDMVSILNALDLLVIASERETGPLVLLEALACGIPVISTPVGRASGLLSPENLFPIGDATALADRLRFWLTNGKKLQTAGCLARDLAKAQLSLEQSHHSIRVEIEDILRD